MGSGGAFESVIFDCDSTLVSVEGIDLLAGPHADAVAELTDRAAGETTRVPLDKAAAQVAELVAAAR